MNLALQFYNERRAQLKDAQPNAAHIGLKELEKYFDVQIITQNVDNLHEKAGSSNVLHLHGILTQARSTYDPELIYDIGYNEIKPGDKCEKGYQLRPNIVWFGEPVPIIGEAIEIASRADIFIVIGTSLFVYPAASLIDFVPNRTPIYLIDPNPITAPITRRFTFIQEKATKGMKILIDNYLSKSFNN